MMISRVIFIVLSICMMMSGVSGLLSFYEGGLRMVDETFDVKIGATSAEVTVDYTLHNQGSASETVTLTFPGALKKYTLMRDGVAFSGSLTLAPSLSTTLRLSYILPLASDVRSLELHPEVLFNGLADGERIDMVKGTLSLPEGAVLQSLPNGFSDAGIVDGMHQYVYSASTLYQPSFSFAWFASDLHLSVTREVSRVRAEGDTLMVTTIVQNTGDEAVRDILVQDSFLQANYVPVSEGFTLLASAFEPAYVWNATLASLGAGEEKTFTYSLQVTNEVNLRTMPLVVFVGGQVVASVDGDFITLGPSLDEQLAEVNVAQDDAFTTAPDRLALVPSSLPPPRFEPSGLGGIDAPSLWMKLLYLLLAIGLVVGGTYGVRRLYVYWQEHRSVSAPRAGVPVPYRSVLK